MFANESDRSIWLPSSQEKKEKRVPETAAGHATSVISDQAADGLPFIKGSRRARASRTNMAPMILEREYKIQLLQRTILMPCIDSKRKAVDQPDFPTAKRIKNSYSHSPEKDKKPINVVPFPEKVGNSLLGKPVLQFSYLDASLASLLSLKSAMATLNSKWSTMTTSGKA